MAPFDNCVWTSKDSITCNGTEYAKTEGPITYHDEIFWIYISVYVVLVLLAGVFSGLTLGLLSMDMTSLRVLREAGTPTQKKHAKRIMPLIKRHHLLLVTLLLANAAAVEAMPLFLDRISDPVIAIVVSVSAVLFFGEVFPQALCSRYGLAIGAYLAPLVYLLMGLTFIISYPVSKFLDCILGKDHSTLFRRAELKALVDLHGPSENASGDRLTYDEVLIIKGAMELRDKTVTDAMVPLENVFMLDANYLLNEDMMRKILQAAHSRIPVYDGSRQNVIGVLLVKTLACQDPLQARPIRDLVRDQRLCKRVHFVQCDTALYDLLNEFQKGKTHMAVVTQPLPPAQSLATSGGATPSDEEQPTTVLTNKSAFSDAEEIVGIITLEDILEELLQEEIIDETDVFVDVRNRIKVARARMRFSQDPIMASRSHSSSVSEYPYRSIRRYQSFPDARVFSDGSRRPSGSDGSVMQPSADGMEAGVRTPVLVDDRTPLLVDVSPPVL